jgi:hypothetical protein
MGFRAQRNASPPSVAFSIVRLYVYNNVAIMLLAVVNLVLPQQARLGIAGRTAFVEAYRCERCRGNCPAADIESARRSLCGLVAGSSPSESLPFPLLVIYIEAHPPTISKAVMLIV